MSTFSGIAKRLLPAPIFSRARRVYYNLRSTKDYEKLYEAHARNNSPTTSIGGGDFDLVGRIELANLLAEGLKSTDTLVDFGCGTGRLAVHVIPRLANGRYIGVDISKTMIAHARALVNKAIPSSTCSVEFQHQTRPEFDLPPKTADMVCAFSVFTHMEHEDNYRYLLSIRKIIKDDGILVFSCLPMDLPAARDIFRAQAEKNTAERWAKVRNVTTSRDLMESLARMSGWEPIRWYAGDDPCLKDPLTSEMHAPGSSVCVFKAV